jgi:hypothetical protein
MSEVARFDAGNARTKLEVAPERPSERAAVALVKDA